MGIIAHINWVDVLAVIIIIRISYVAFQDGLSHEIFPLFGTAVTLVLAFHYSPMLSFFISNNIPGLSDGVVNFISFSTLIAVFGIIFKILRSIIDKIIKVTWHPALDKFGGLVFGVVRSGFVVCIVLTTIALIPAPYLERSVKDKSLVGTRFLNIGPAVYSKVSKYLPAVETGVRDILPTQKKTKV